MVNYRKQPTERDIVEWLGTGQLKLPPLRFERFESSLTCPGWGVAIEATWQDGRARFVIECKAQSTPKVFRAALGRVEGTPLPPGYLPLLIMPYLRESQLAELEQRQISGVDLCGNGVVIIPGRLSVYRTGAKNQFPSYSPIKNIYRKNTSMVARALVAKPRYEEVKDLREAINSRNLLVARWGKTAMSLGTVSKALSGLEDDLIIDRCDGVCLLQADKLLALLSESYEKPLVTKRVRMKIACDWKDLTTIVRAKSDAATVPVVATGLSSVSRYATMQRENILSVYCPGIAALLEQLHGNENDRFPNLELTETQQQPLYFDTREEHGLLWASPLQTFLELAAGDKRDRETAEQVRSHLLNRIAGGPS